MLISNASHSALRQVRRLEHRKDRDWTGLFFVEGVRFVHEAHANRQHIQAIVVCPEMLNSPRGRKTAAHLGASGVETLRVTRAVYESLVQTGDCQGIAAVVRQSWVEMPDIPLSRGPVWIGLEEVQSPGNLGTLLRTCEAAGGAGAVLLGPQPDPYDTAVVRSSMGAIHGLRFARCGHAEFARWKAAAGVRVIGTSPRGAVDYRDADYSGPVVLFLGPERRGMNEGQTALCDEVVRIPMVGRADSLNLGVAGSLMLYEAFHHRRRGIHGRACAVPGI
jgi:TrmH family RNA methyltransferase